MSTQHDGSTSVGAGPGNDSMSGSQKGSGGSGGEQLTRSLHDTHSDAPPTKVDLIDEATPVAPEGAGTAATAATRGPQDTHSHQAGSTPTGLGAPETGANQQVSDLPPPKQ